MTGVISKWFVNSVTEFPGGGKQYTLGVVCRGEENKHWAAATPSGQATIKTVGHADDDVLSAVVVGDAPHEVTMTLRPAEDGDWIMDKCDFTYGGCQTHYRQKAEPWGEMSMTVNAADATLVLRKAYADSLLAGEPGRFALTIDKP
jgi:hypothetical protein